MTTIKLPECISIYTPRLLSREFLIALLRGIGRTKIYIGADGQLWRWITEKEFKMTLDPTIEGIGQHTLASTPDAVCKFLAVYTQKSLLRDRWITMTKNRSYRR